MLSRQTGSTFAVYAQVQCREPKTGQEKVHFSSEDDLLFISSYYIFIYDPDSVSTYKIIQVNILARSFFHIQRKTDEGTVQSWGSRDIGVFQMGGRRGVR